MYSRPDRLLIYLSGYQNIIAFSMSISLLSKIIVTDFALFFKFFLINREKR